MAIWPRGYTLIQFVNGNIFERVILIKWLSINWLLQHVRLIDFFAPFCPLFYVPSCSRLSKGTWKKGTKRDVRPPSLYNINCLLLICRAVLLLWFDCCVLHSLNYIYQFLRPYSVAYYMKNIWGWQLYISGIVHYLLLL